MNETRPGYGQGLLLVSLAALVWGTIGVAVSLLYQLADTNSFSVGFLRLLIAAPALLFFCRMRVGPGCWRVSRSHLLAIGLIGVATATYQLSYFAAIPRLGVAAAVMINICSAPIITAVLAGLVLGERLGRVTILALLGAVIGTGLLVGGIPQAASSSELWIGALLALGAGLSYSLVALGGRAVAPFYHPLQPTALAFTLGALLLLPPALASGLVLDYPPLGWLLLLYLGLVPTALAYVLYLRGLQAVPATVAATLSLLEPLGSTLLAVLLLGERLNLRGMLGAGILLASMALLYLGRASQRPTDQASGLALAPPNESNAAQ